MLKTALHYSHDLLKEVVTEGDLVIDGTVGNGNDTLFLAELVGETGTVLGFDVQEQAIQTTQAILNEAGLNKQVTLYQQGHETLGLVIPAGKKVKAAIFNLGYLPKSDKTIITQSHTTLKALEDLLTLTEDLGRIIVVIYYGHDGGEIEKNAVLDFVKQIPQTQFNVLSYQFINQKNNPPILITIEKKAQKIN